MVPQASLGVVFECRARTKLWALVDVTPTHKHARHTFSPGEWRLSQELAYVVTDKIIKAFSCLDILFCLAVEPGTKSKTPFTLLFPILESTFSSLSFSGCDVGSHTLVCPVWCMCNCLEITVQVSTPSVQDWTLILLHARQVFYTESIPGSCVIILNQDEKHFILPMRQLSSLVQLNIYFLKVTLRLFGFCIKTHLSWVSNTLCRHLVLFKFFIIYVLSFGKNSLERSYL